MFPWQTRDPDKDTKAGVPRVRHIGMPLRSQLPSGGRGGMDIDCLEVVARDPTESTVEEPASTSSQDVRFETPLQLRFTGTAAGRPDLQLQLFSFSQGVDAIREVKREAQNPLPPTVEALAKVTGQAATLMFLRVVFPDSFPRVQRVLARAGMASAAIQLATAAVSEQRRYSLARRPRQRPKAGQSRWRRLRWSSIKERVPKEVKEALPNVEGAARWAFTFAPPAAALACAALLWSRLHPSSHRLGQAIMVAMQLSAGYAQTQRQAATGQIPSGPQLEAAWRARHKWAARRSGPVLEDAYDNPPLQPLLTAAQRVSIGLVLLVHGTPLGTSVLTGAAATGAGSAWGASPPGSGWLLQASFPAGRRLPEEPLTAADVQLEADATQQTLIGTDLPKAQAAPLQPLEAEPPAVNADVGSGEIQPAPLAPLPAAPEHAAVSSHAASSSGEAAAQPSTSTSGRFVPAPEENLATGAYPTICSQAELAAYRRRHGAGPPKPSDQPPPGPSNAEPDAANQGRSPFEIAANATSAAQPANDNAGTAVGGRPAVAAVGAVLEASPPQENEMVPFNSEELEEMDPGIREPGGHNQAAHAALFGQGDHLQEAPLTLADRRDMAYRSVYLLTVFMPFLLFGPLLLYLAARLPARQPLRLAAPAAPMAKAAAAADVAEDRAGPAEVVEAEEILTTDVVPTRSERMQTTAWRLLLYGIRASGAAFIKWGQWSATREDIFPTAFCRVLAELHDRAPVHSWEASKREIEAAFGRSVEELFESIDHEPLASGSVAQVHRAVMRINGQRRDVAVKVRHPGVAVRLKQDFQLLKPLAAAASKVRSLKGLSLKESLAQFSSTMTAQTDLRVEATHLRRFFRNFASVRHSVTPPFPLPDYISESVLIETFEPGQSVAKYIRQPAPFNTQIVALGVDTYLKMLLTDNFVHTDLHPGNILVRRGDGKTLSADTSAEAVRGKLQLILLDFGLAEELTPTVRRHFISFLHMIAAGNGKRAAWHILRWGAVQQCPDPVGFTAAMVELFRTDCNIQAPAGIELDSVMKSVLRIARQFEVSIDSGYAALVVGVCVLVGFATALDPAVNLMDAAAPAFLQHNLLGKISGRLYS